MKQQILDNARNTIVGHLNTNSFCSKFVYFDDMIKLLDMFLFFESSQNWTIHSE